MKCARHCLRHVLATTATIAMVSGCGGDDAARWTEDVKLHDGTIIQVERRATRVGSGLPVEHRGPLKTDELCYPPAKAYWKLGSEYRPASFELKDGVPYVKVSVLDCGSCKAAGFPQDGMAYFALRQGHWVSITSSEFPDSRWRNLMIEGIWDGRDSSKDLRGHVSLQTKMKSDQFAEDTRAGKVLRESEAVICQECAKAHIRGDVPMIPAATPTDSFCK